jgi:hypothetical protein
LIETHRVTCFKCFEKVHHTAIDDSFCHNHVLCYKCTELHSYFSFESDGKYYKSYFCHHCMEVKRKPTRLVIKNFPLQFELE